MTFEEIKINTKFKAVSKYTKENVRCMREEGGTTFVFAKGKSRYGHRYMDGQFKTLYEITEPDPGETWEKQVRKVAKCLRASGLWSNILQVFENLEKVSYQDWKKMQDIYWSKTYLDPVDSKYKHRTDTEMRALWGTYPDKYPFMFNDTDGTLNADTDYLFEMSAAKTKTMYFGFSNAKEKECISKALSEKSSYSTGRIPVNYDVSFEYDSEKNKAWYQEEYKNCGNGYYYLAIDGNTALFIEKD